MAVYYEQNYEERHSCEGVAFFFLIGGRCALPTRSPTVIHKTMLIIDKIFVGIIVQGASVRRVRVRAFQRVRNGKPEQVRAHWRYVKR